MCPLAAVVASAAVLVVALSSDATKSAGSEQQQQQPAVSASVKARVESGVGVPFYDERFSCRDDGGVWSEFRELVHYARLRIFDADEGPQLARFLAAALAARMSNVTEVLQCNVGVIAGYHLLARRHIAEGDDWRAYRLLQLALIFIFTLRNAVTVPPDLAHDWFTSTEHIVQEIRLLRERLSREQERRLARLPHAAPDLRIPGLRVAVVSICAYPEDHPLVLRTVTPENRKAYVQRHGYTLHLHRSHPMPGSDVHIQHAKLALVANYLRSGDYDWVAWLDCDSILMNLDRTLDSVIYRYARRDARPRGGTGGEEADVAAQGPADSGADTSKSAETIRTVAFDDIDAVHAEETADEPLPHERLEVYVTHAGSCNTDEGCRAVASLRVNRNTSYLATVAVAQADMAAPDERLASVSVGGADLGECNPSPESDYDCGFHECFRSVAVPAAATADGVVALAAHAVRTHHDCRCSLLRGVCYSAAVAQLEEVTGMGKTTDPGYGMFVKFTLEPQEAPIEVEPSHMHAPDNTSHQQEQHQLLHEEQHLQQEHAPLGCSCAWRSGSSEAPAASPATFWRATAARLRADSATDGSEADGRAAQADDLSGPALVAAARPWARLRRRNAECAEEMDVLLGVGISLEACLDACRGLEDCIFVSYGFGLKRGQCYWELGECLEFEEDFYAVWDVRASEDTAEGPRQPLDCSQTCATAEAAEALASAESRPVLGDDRRGGFPTTRDRQAGRDAGAGAGGVAGVAMDAEREGIDLLITDEGWGLSSANWLIRRSNWSIGFLERAFALCHEEMPLFGDQDAMIHLLLNRGALRVDDAFRGDPLDGHAVIIPQRELNAYDALNAFHMRCDAYEEGDLLVTFPGCKEAAACNPLFLLAAAHAEGVPMDMSPEAHLRVFGPPWEAAAAYDAALRAQRKG